MTSVAELTLRSPVEPWERIGLRVVDGESWIGGIRLRLEPADDQPQRVVGWTLIASPSTPPAIDGLATSYLDDFDPQAWQHPLGVTGFDHVVVMTSSLERTCGQIERVTGEPLKRVREAGSVRQGFHRFGALVVEVVESAEVSGTDAEFWGFVLVVDDLYDAADRLGPDLLSPPKPAVQPARHIASFRGSAGLGLPVALMSPHTR